MLQAVIFDMDGVIIDSEPIYSEVNDIIFNRYGIIIEKEEYSTFVGRTAQDVWAHIKNKHKLSESVDNLIRMENDGFIEQFKLRSDINAIKGSLELIDELHKNNIILGLASSSLRRTISAVIDFFDINSYFKAVVSGEDVQRGKPAPDIFLHTAKLLKVEPDNCIVIEDSRNGVKSAKASGMKCIGYKNINSGNQDLSDADLITDDLSSINYEELKSMY
jgi:HAD superfamily hydrolase (TIGR01509 family)